MTPQEKADNLVNQYRIVLMREDTDCGNEILCTTIAKQCALIAVDEIIELLDHTPLIDDDYAEHIINYWNEVKQEIEKL